MNTLLPAYKTISEGATRNFGSLLEDFIPVMFLNIVPADGSDADNVWFTLLTQCAAGPFRCGLRQQNGMEKVTG